MKRILFVDDEPNVLEALQRMLRPQRDTWEIACAPGGEAAMALMDANPFDVIISDMRMPGMDGAELLRRVRERHPEVVRIVLSGHTELEAALRAVPVAHQFLLKPCDPETLRVAIGRATSLYEVLNSPTLARIVGPTHDLPSLPRTFAALREELSKPDVALDKVAKIVEQDVAISAKILQLVNSAFFGLQRDIATVRTAVSYIGVSVLQSLVLSAEVFRVFKDSDRIPGFSMEDLYAHSQLTARIAGSMNACKRVPEAPLVAALLHDVGKLVLATRIPKQFAQVLSQAQQEQRPLHEVEKEVLGISHAEVGACLLGLWGLPCIIVEAVAHHHTPTRVPSQNIDAIAAVHIANALAHERMAPDPKAIRLIHPPVDPDYLDDIGATEQLPIWAAAADSASRELAGIR